MQSLVNQILPSVLVVADDSDKCSSQATFKIRCKKHRRHSRDKNLKPQLTCKASCFNCFDEHGVLGSCKRLMERERISAGRLDKPIAVIVAIAVELIGTTDASCILFKANSYRRGFFLAITDADGRTLQ